VFVKYIPDPAIFQTSSRLAEAGIQEYICGRFPKNPMADSIIRRPRSGGVARRYSGVSSYKVGAVTVTIGSNSRFTVESQRPGYAESGSTIAQTLIFSRYARNMQTSFLSFFSSVPSDAAHRRYIYRMMRAVSDIYVVELSWSAGSLLSSFQSLLLCQVSRGRSWPGIPVKRTDYRHDPQLKSHRRS
jgi:hypothetical protein